MTFFFLKVCLIHVCGSFHQNILTLHKPLNLILQADPSQAGKVALLHGLTYFKPENNSNNIDIDLFASLQPVTEKVNGFLLLSFYKISECKCQFCADKVPYNLIQINLGSTYEVFSESVTCSETGIKDGKLLLICTGPMALSFEVKVCDPACAIPIYPAQTIRCPEDLNYNELYGCCEREPIPIDDNCVVLKLDTISCVVGCSEYTDQATCDKNGRACRWDREREVCYPR